MERGRPARDQFGAAKEASPMLKSKVHPRLPGAQRGPMATLEAPPLPLRIHHGPFTNEPMIDFSKDESVAKMRAALARVRAELGREYDMVIGGRRLRTAEKISSINPSHPAQLVGLHQNAGTAEVEPAMQAALAAFPAWSRRSPEERASFVFHVADIIRERRFEFCAWLVFEVSKNWGEADADIAETIDFCELYAREALRMAHVETPTQLPGERDQECTST